jgi:hypothetical protein
MRRWWWALVLVAAVAAAFGVVPGTYVVAVLMGVGIWRVGVASLGSLRRGPGSIPDGPSVPVDARSERVTYWCSGCGTELLLLVRGSASPPRHCGERMTERREVPRGARG